MSSVISLKLREAEKQQLKAIAEERQMSLSSLIREGINHVLKASSTGEIASCYERMADLFDSGQSIDASGLGDLSTDKSRLSRIGKK